MLEYASMLHAFMLHAHIRPKLCWHKFTKAYQETNPDSWVTLEKISVATHLWPLQFFELAWVGWSRKLVTKHFTVITSLFLQWHSLSFLCSSPRDRSVAKVRLCSHTPFIVPQLRALMLTLFCQLVELLQYGELAYCILHARCSQYVAVLQYIQM